MNFIIHVGIAVIIIAVGGLVSSTAANDPARFAFGIAAIAAQMELFLSAWYLRSKSTPRFDMTIAAETLVAFGVFSLIVGIVLAVIATRSLNINITGDRVSLAEFDPLLISFGEGLLASAVAPLLATILRQIELLKYAPHSGSGASGEPLDLLKHDADKVAKALSQLRIETEAATKHTASFAKASKSILGGLNELAASIREAKGIVPSALSSVSRDIGDAGPSLTAAFNTAAGNIRAGSGHVSTAFDTTTDHIRTGAGHVSAAFESAANNIGADGGLVSKALAATGSSLGSFTTGVASSAETIRKMTDELDRLGTDARAATGLLTRLQELIESVTNFIRPDKS